MALPDVLSVLYFSVSIPPRFKVWKPSSELPMPGGSFVNR